MAEMRTWTTSELRTAVADALASRSATNPWYLADVVLAALGIDGDVTVVQGRLEKGSGDWYFVVPPHPEPGQP